MQDIAVLAGGQVISKEVELKLEDVTPDHCGLCKLVSLVSAPSLPRCRVVFVFV